MSETAATPNRRVLYIVLGAIAALLVVVVVLLAVLLSTINAQADQRNFEDCMARQGFSVDEQAPLMDESDASVYIDGLADAAEFCDR